ncbi:hypothetical protein GCM10010468_33890 [Actinocorallia longicatena]|uniref:Uncharacterized protein n=1 Tax=Actinocorallia longicatena TaxID=111803 RepID=A0ABP6QD63_9ACTN
MPLAFDRNRLRSGASLAQPGRLTRAARNRCFHRSSLMVHVYNQSRAGVPVSLTFWANSDAGNAGDRPERARTGPGDAPIRR